VSANIPALLTVAIPVNSRSEPLCTRNIQSAPNSKEMNIKTCSWWQLMSAAHVSIPNPQQQAYICQVFLDQSQKNMLFHCCI